MVEKCRKIITVLLISLLIISLTTNVQAKLVQTFEIVNTKEVKSLENEQGTITKEILQISKEQKQVDMQIKLENTFNKDTEIVFVIDDSTSMGTVVSNNESRKKKVVSATKTLLTELFKNVKDFKAGVIKFSDNASVISAVSDKESDATAKLDTFINTAPGGSTNVVSGIQYAKSMYSSNAKQKVMIVLTDGAPTNSLQDVKNALIDAKNNGISIFTGIIDIEQASNLAECFGTVEKPVAGRLYDIKSTVMSEIAKEIQEIIQKETSGSMYNIKIEDYFPQEVIDNFIIQIGNPTKGKITDKLSSDREIVWEIDELARGESATLPFSLIGKEQESINKNLKTNEKLVLSYKDALNKEYEQTLDNQPEVKVKTEGKKDNNSNNSNNSNSGTNGNKVTRLPQTGEAPLGLIFVAVGLIILQLVIHYKKYKEACKK